MGAGGKPLLSDKVTVQPLLSLGEMHCSAPIAIKSHLTPFPALRFLPLVHHRRGLAECFALLKTKLVSWMSENGLGTMVPIQKLESHAPAAVGK